MDPVKNQTKLHIIFAVRLLKNIHARLVFFKSFVFSLLKNNKKKNPTKDFFPDFTPEAVGIPKEGMLEDCSGLWRLEQPGGVEALGLSAGAPVQAGFGL